MSNQLHTVLGATGATGNAVIRELKNRNLPVGAVRRHPHAENVITIQADLLKPEETKNAVRNGVDYANRITIRYLLSNSSGLPDYFQQKKSNGLSLKDEVVRGNYMKLLKHTSLPVLLATIWISISEFVRNEIILKSYWTAHYQLLGLSFPSKPVNGAVGGLWSLCFAIVIFIISKKFSLLQTTFLSRFVGFVLMWIVIWNMNVLPCGILFFAIPLSLLEAFVANFIIKKIA